MFRIATFLIAGLFFSASALADHGEWRHHHHHHGHHRHHHGHDHGYYPVYRERVFVPQPIVEYVPARPRYYAPPPPPPAYYRYDQRSPQGMIGGIVGSAMGYELGRGDPMAAGIGAAAGAWLGNGMY
ncbi:MAG: hypothetical protein ACU836_01240 [Gammaproteobacteria bacterium]